MNSLDGLLKKSSTIFDFLSAHIKSKAFLYFLVSLIFVQGAWYAFNFVPALFDEPTHLGIIELYGDRTNPFISTQDESWDFLGDVTRNSSYLYYYLMSIPLKFFTFIGLSSFGYTVALRLLHTAIFACGILVFERALRKLNFSIVISRLSLLFLVATPSVALLAGAVNYDNVIFLFSGLLFLNVATILRSKTVNLDTIVQFSTICMFGILMKYTFVALAFPVALFVLAHSIKNKKLARSSFNVRKANKLLLIIFLVGVVLFIERPVMNLVEYGRLSPRCASIMEEQRCYQNYTQKRNIDARQNKPDTFEPKSLYEFTFVDWLPNMIRTQIRLQPTDVPNKSILLLYYVGLFGGLSLTMYWLHRLMRSKAMPFVLWSIASLSLALLLRNYGSYERLGIVVATSSRYLLPVQPLFMAVVLSSVSLTFRRHRVLLLPLIVFAIFALMSGWEALISLYSASEFTEF